MFNSKFTIDMRVYSREFKERVKELINCEAFSKPISELNKDYSKKGTIILITKIKPQWKQI